VNQNFVLSVALVRVNQSGCPTDLKLKSFALLSFKIRSTCANVFWQGNRRWQPDVILKSAMTLHLSLRHADHHSATSGRIAIRPYIRTPSPDFFAFFAPFARCKFLRIRSGQALRLPKSSFLRALRVLRGENFFTVNPEEPVT
jgi:hypothetical protein